MKWIKEAKKLDPTALPLIVPASADSWGKIEPGQIAPSKVEPVKIEPVKKVPEPEDVPLNVALDALSAHGIMVKQMNQTTSYSYDGLEFDLSMTILVDPKSGQQTLNQLNDWFFGKAFKKW